MKELREFYGIRCMDWIESNGNTPGYKRRDHLKQLDDPKGDGTISIGVINGDDHMIMSLSVKTREEWDAELLPAKSIEKAHKLLAERLAPNSGVSDEMCFKALLEILDNKELVKAMKSQVKS